MIFSFNLSFHYFPFWPNLDEEGLNQKVQLVKYGLQALDGMLGGLKSLLALLRLFCHSLSAPPFIWNFSVQSNPAQGSPALWLEHPRAAGRPACASQGAGKGVRVGLTQALTSGDLVYMDMRGYVFAQRFTDTAAVWHD